MEFDLVLKRLLREFKEEKVRYALMGGFALGALGIPRATFDLDFLVNREDLDKIDRILKALGYELYFRSENVSQYKSSDPKMGNLDFLHAFRKISLEMLNRAMRKKIFNQKEVINVLEPEDIIGLKIQALANDPGRKTKEIADIEAILDLYKDKLDWERIREYFKLFEMEDEFEKLKLRFGNVE